MINEITKVYYFRKRKGTKMTFVQELEGLINKHSVENISNTPDFILAKFMFDCLKGFEKASLERERWFSVSLDIKNNWEGLIMVAMGGASMCWEHVDKAGVFDSDRAKEIGKKLLEDIKYGCGNREI